MIEIIVFVSLVTIMFIILGIIKILKYMYKKENINNEYC